MNKRIIFSLILASAFFMANSANAADLQNEINTDVLGYDYVNNTILGDQNSVFDTAQLNQYTYTQEKNNLTISDYTSMPKAERQKIKMQNKYAVLDNDLVFDPTNSNLDDLNFWVRPYGSIEKVRVIDAEKVKTKTYGIYAGVNSGIKELSHGWEMIMGGYTGYTGAHINDDYTKTYQNGGTLGFETMFLKDNFFTGFDVSAGVGSGQLKVRYTDYDINSTFVNAGLSNKTGYNWELADGKFIIQPSLVSSFVFAHTMGHSKDFGDGLSLSIENDSMYSVLLEPGINFIGNFGNGWQPYAGVSMVWNLANSNHVMPMYAMMPDMAARNFVKYGVGVTKKWNDRFSANLQTFVRNGGRSGIGFQGGFAMALGK